MSENVEQIDVLALAAEVVSAYVASNPVPLAQLPDLIASVHKALTGIGKQEEAPAPEPKAPAVPIKKSVTPDYIVSLEDGKKFKSLKRHLATAYGMSPEQYRAKWNLPADYPMVAPNYAAKRSELAKEIGLGRKAAPTTPVAPAKAGSASRGGTRRNKSAGA